MGVYVGLCSHAQEQVQVLKSHLPVPSVTVSLSSLSDTLSVFVLARPSENARLWKLQTIQVWLIVPPPRASYSFPIPICLS